MWLMKLPPHSSRTHDLDIRINEELWSYRKVHPWNLDTGISCLLKQRVLRSIEAVPVIALACPLMRASSCRATWQIAYALPHYISAVFWLDDLNDNTSHPPILLDMPCSLCGTWVMEPLWQECDKKWVNEKGAVRLHNKDYTTCSESWDGTYWFFFCDRCKANKPHRETRFWHPEGRIEQTTESECSCLTSDEESFTSDERKQDHLTQETAWTKSPWQKCFCTRGIMKKLVINLTAYTKIKLYRTCKHIYLGNKKKVQWWVNMDRMIQEVTGEKGVE